MSLVAGTFHQFLSAIKPLRLFPDYLAIEVGMAMKRRETARRASDFLLVIVFFLLLVMPYCGRHCTCLWADLVICDI